MRIANVALASRVGRFIGRVFRASSLGQHHDAADLDSERLQSGSLGGEILGSVETGAYSTTSSFTRTMRFLYPESRTWRADWWGMRQRRCGNGRSGSGGAGRMPSKLR